MNCVKETSFIFSLYIILSFHIHHFVCEEEIFKTESCPKYFKDSFPESPTAWTIGKAAGKEYCSVCSEQDASWLVTNLISAPEDIKSIHVNVQMFRSECAKCKDQNITVYILRKALPAETKDKEAVGILKNLTLVATLSNQVINTAKFHEFYFEPKAPKFSIVFLSAGSCTRIQDIRLSYFFCDKNTSYGITLLRTFAPVNGSQRVNVSCPVNTLNPDNEEAYGLCSSKGIWEIISPCICKKGYTLNTNEEGCTGVLMAGISKSDGLPEAVVIVVSVVAIILMIIIILVICWFKRRKTRQSRASQRLSGGDISLLYVDPITYDSPERALSEFTKQLDRNLIKFGAIVGGGEFGDVYKGEMKLPEQPAMKVAIKTLKPGASHKNRTDFLIEASVMGQFKNLNVITLEGVVTKSTPLLIVTEFMENGSLDKYLKENDGMLKPLQLLGMARGVASGMEYLAGMHFVHRDLAARNVLVNDNLSCKVADFGLSRDLDNTEDSEYESQGGKIAVRWTAPEAISDLKFSTASDIWSYGILLWEIMSFAERPYRNWRNGEVVIWVNQGYRLPPPMICPKTVHELMKECWMTDRTKRLPFKEIVRIIDEWIKYPEKLNEDYIKVRRIEPLDNSTFTSVKDWLGTIEMGMYASNFSMAGYEELSDVAQLTEDELLKKVGVTLEDHRHKMYERIKEMSEVMKLKREQPVKI